jgi:hypothetical protein
VPWAAHYRTTALPHYRTTASRGRLDAAARKKASGRPAPIRDPKLRISGGRTSNRRGRSWRARLIAMRCPTSEPDITRLAGVEGGIRVTVCLDSLLQPRFCCSSGSLSAFRWPSFGQRRWPQSGQIPVAADNCAGRRRKRFLTAEQKYDSVVRILTGRVTKWAAATEVGVERTVITRIRAVSHGGAIAAPQASRPGKTSVSKLDRTEIVGLRGEVAGRKARPWNTQSSWRFFGEVSLGMIGPVPARVDPTVTAELLSIINDAVALQVDLHPNMPFVRS